MDPQVKALLEFMAASAAGAPKMTELPAAVARANTEVGFAAFNAGAPEIGSIVDRTIPGPGGEIPVKIFTPKGEGPFPLLVYIHGGGWVIMSPDTHAKLCAELAEGAGVVIVSPHYRLAPENLPPAQLDDCMATVHWAVKHAAELNADGSRFAIGGDSAGGNLAAAACLRLRDEGGPTPRLQLLLYAALLLDPDTESSKVNADAQILSRETMVWFINHYLSGGAKTSDPYIAPINGDLHGLPPARLIVGTLDPLMDDSKAYAAKLKAAGVPAALSIYEDMPHVFLQLSAMLDGGQKGVAEACGALREALA
ncbi:MAG: lipase [Anaerolinea sp.]|nr:lipase [Anaerolinea sp.]